MQNTSGGLLLLVLAGVMNATFSLPMKFTRGWKWENTWLLWSLFALVLVPGMLAFSTVPGYGSVLAAAGGVLLPVVLCGAAWGVAQVLFGRALDKIGIALTFSIVLGLSAAVGSLIPLLRFHSDQLFARGGLVSLAGIALVLAGVATSAVAGKLRDRGRDAQTATSGFGAGLGMAIASGICASMMNVGFAYGSPLSDVAASRGTSVLWLSGAVWMPLLLGGAVPNVLYAVYLLRKNKSAENFPANAGRNIGLTLVMALLWFGSSVVYGVSTLWLGDLGKVVGWPLFMSLIVIVAGAVGLATGEWKNSGSKALRVQGLAVLILVCAIVVLSRATI